MANPIQTDKKVLLIIDDDESIRETLQQVLEIEGFDVLAAAEGKTGLEVLKLNKEKIGVVLLDLMMPEMNGWQFLEVQQNDPEISAIPVIVITAFPNESGSIRPSAILKKPLDPESLIERILPLCG